MNIGDSLHSLKDFWGEFSKAKIGLAGFSILVAFALLGIFGGLLVPFPDAAKHWRDIDYWQDNPQAAPPAWTNAFAIKKGVPSSVLAAFKAEEETQDNGVSLRTFTFDYPFSYDKPPRDLIVRVPGSGQVPMTIALERPDGLSAELYREQLELTAGSDNRISVARNCSRAAIEFVRGQDEALANSMNADLIKPIDVLFAKMAPDMADHPAILKGDYKIKIRALIVSPDFSVGRPSILVSGHVSGIMGTDASKRDIFTGIVLGIRWALIIGILTSVVSVVAGVLLGIVAGYFGGVADWLLTRLYELIYLLPVLPFLIVVAAIFKPSIWVLIAIICAFFWTGSFKTVYSMTLQIKEETFVEASRALGSSRWRIVFKHITPILLPYSFASMALSIPAIIVYEASVSLLGLGDATIVSWGQILESALTQGAVINNLWWWVIPPGLMIALMGMSFAFLGTALDKILHPKLKTR
jgi:peptide/nickel transport system permease protein